MLNSGRYKQYLTIPEAALVWSNLPLDLLAEAAWPSPGVPLIVGHPEVTARAEALIEATDWGQLMECSRSDPDIPLPRPDRRMVHRKALLEWIAEHWPDELPGKTPPKIPSATPPKASERQTVADRLLAEDETIERLGISRSTLWRRIKTGEIPGPAQEKPNRWSLSSLTPYIRGQAAPAAEEDSEI